MVCPKCGSNIININVINEVKEKPEHSVLWWIFVGWWWRLLWFIFFGWWYMIYRAVKGSKKTVNVQKTYAVCQNCGHKWRV